ncbi:hypothetical protein PGQ11_008374 [Apiospora arundinis]|uniref:Uncharacterized protein n=1 Tax=Apiospora arundinis TaxID=335852 RepID=A0ABR2IF40_9PEZI
MPERKSGHTGFPDMPPSAMSKTEMWKNKLERKSRATDKELGFDKVTAENADEWLNARINRIAQENQQRAEASWVQLQAGLEFQRKMSRGVLPSSKETPPPSENGGTRSRPNATATARATQKRSPDQYENEIASTSRPRRCSPGEAKQQRRRQSARSSPAKANDDDEEVPNADIPQPFRGQNQPKATHQSPRSQNKEKELEQEESQSQAHPRKRPRADPLDTNLGPGWDFHLVRGNRPTKIRSNGYTT